MESAPILASLIQRLKNRTAVVAVLGLGYVGLPFATVFAEAGFKVVGIDPIAEKVAMIQRGESYVLDVTSDQVARLLGAGRLQATTEFSALSQVDAVAICVPTPLRKTGDPDLSFIVSATEAWQNTFIRAWWWCLNPPPTPARPAR